MTTQRAAAQIIADFFLPQVSFLVDHLDCILSKRQNAHGVAVPGIRGLILARVESVALVVFFPVNLASVAYLLLLRLLGLPEARLKAQDLRVPFA